MKTYIVLTFILCSVSGSCQNSKSILTAQGEHAMRFMDSLEKGNTTSAFQMLEPNYHSKKKGSLQKFYSLFKQDFNSLTVGTKRYVQSVFPSGYNLFRFRYINSDGVVLQVDLSFKAQANSLIADVGLISTKSLEKQRKTNIVAGYDYN